VSGAFSSRRGPGEGAIKNLAKQTKFYGPAMQTSLSDVLAFDHSAVLVSQDAAETSNI
jgi:hypothetical protein